MLARLRLHAHRLALIGRLLWALPELERRVDELEDINVHQAEAVVDAVRRS